MPVGCLSVFARVSPLCWHGGHPCWTLHFPRLPRNKSPAASRPLRATAAAARSVAALMCPPRTVYLKRIPYRPIVAAILSCISLCASPPPETRQASDWVLPWDRHGLLIFPNSPQAPARTESTYSSRDRTTHHSSLTASQTALMAAVGASQLTRTYLLSCSPDTTSLISTIIFNCYQQPHRPTRSF